MLQSGIGASPLGQRATEVIISVLKQGRSLYNDLGVIDHGWDKAIEAARRFRQDRRFSDYFFDQDLSGLIPWEEPEVRGKLVDLSMHLYLHEHETEPFLKADSAARVQEAVTVIEGLKFAGPLSDPDPFPEFTHDVAEVKAQALEGVRAGGEHIISELVELERIARAADEDVEPILAAREAMVDFIAHPHESRFMALSRLVDDACLVAADLGGDERFDFAGHQSRLRRFMIHWALLVGVRQRLEDEEPVNPEILRRGVACEIAALRDVAEGDLFNRPEV